MPSMPVREEVDQFITKYAIKWFGIQTLHNSYQLDETLWRLVWLTTSVEFELQWVIELFLLSLHFLAFLLLFLDAIALDYSFGLALSLSLLKLFLKDSSPRTIDWSWNPGFYFYSGNSLHSKNFERNAITTMNGVGYSLYVFVMLALSVLNHGVDGWKLLGAFRTAEVLGFLMVVQDDFVFETFLAVEAERTQARHVSLFSAHLL